MKGDACKSENSKKGEIVKGKDSQETLAYFRGEFDNSNIFLCRGQGRVPTRLETQCWGLG